MKALLTPSRTCAVALVCAWFGVAMPHDVQAQLSIGLTATEYHGGEFHVSEHDATDGGITSTVSGGTEPYSYAWKRLEGAMGYTAMGTAQHLSDVGGGEYRLVVTDSTGVVDSASVFLSEPGLMIIMPQVTHLTCANVANGSATLTVTGGVTPYTYLWTHSTGSGQGTGDTLSSTTGLGAGQHHVTVTSAGGAQRTEYFSVNAPMPLAGTIIQTGWAMCHGDTVVMAVNAWGGTPPYSYHWSTGAFTQQMKTVQGGQYSVQVTDMHNCQTTDSIYVSMPQALTATINYLPYPNGTPFSCDTCNDGTIQVTPTGGMEPYTAMWSTGHMGTVLNGMYADSAYHVSVTDMQGCQWQSDTIVATRGVAYEQPLGVFLFAHQYAGGHHVSHAGAADGSLEAVVVGGMPPYTMVWSTGDTVAELDSLPAGHYTVTVTDQNGVQRTRSKTLTSPPPLSVSMTGGLGSCMTGGGQMNAFVNGGAPPYTYEWYRNDSLYDSTHNYPYLYIHQAGTYRVQVADANADTVTTQMTVNAIATLTTSLTATEVQPGYHATCHGDTVQLSLTVNGGSEPYSYMWEHGSFQKNPKVMSGGWKTVRVTDMVGCHVDDSIYINIPEELNTQDMMPHVYANGKFFSCDTCSDGRLYLPVIEGGVPPYSVLWSDGSTGDSLVGIAIDSLISITITDALGCVFYEEGSLPWEWEPDMPELMLYHDKSQYAGGYHVSCAGCMDGHIQLWPGGGVPPYSYQWMDGDSAQHRYGLMAGMYSVTVTDAHGQSLWREFTLLGPGGGLSVHISNNTTYCNGMVQGSLYASVMGGVPPYTYQWERDGMMLAEMWDYMGVWQTGGYRVTVMDASGQTAQDSVQVGMGAGLTVTAEAMEKYGNAHTGCTVADGTIELHFSGGMPPYNVNVSRTGGHREFSSSMESSYQHWFSTMDTVAVLDSLQAGQYHISVSDMGGCNAMADLGLRSPGPLRPGTEPLVYPNGHYVSCDTCADASLTATALGAHGAVEYVWVQMPDSEAPLRIRGASLFLSDMGDSGDAGWMFDPENPYLVATGPQATGLEPEVFHALGARDALGCMGQKFFSVERPAPTPTALPAWGIHGNDGNGAAAPSTGEDGPWLGTTDSTDVVMKANGQERIRLHAEGNTSVKDTLVTEHLRVEGTTYIDSIRSRHIRAERITSFMPGDSLIFFGDSTIVFNHVVNSINVLGRGLNGNLYIQNQEASAVYGSTPSNHTILNRFRGSVGIGVGIPTERLHVVGDVRITGTKLHVAQNGNVGIGTSNPQGRLEVRVDEIHGRAISATFLEGGNTRNLFLVPRLGSNGYNYLSKVGDMGLFWTDGAAGGGQNESAGLVIGPWGHAARGIRIAADGKVQVTSTLSACKLVVEVLEGCDFVFDPEYGLPSLMERRSQILSNRHLSGISSANEMEREGMSLSETTLGILRNVEEHELYLYQHDAKLSELQKLIERQQQVIDEQQRMMSVLLEQMEELNRKLSKK